MSAADVTGPDTTRSNGATNGVEAAQLLVEADLVFGDIENGNENLAAAYASDLKAGIAKLADGTRAKTLGAIQAKIAAADPKQQGKLSEMFGVDRPSAPPTGSKLTDTANGERLAFRYGGRLRHVGAWGWLLWDGRRWAIDDTGELYRMAKDTARAIYEECAQAADDEEAKKIASWASRSLSMHGLDAMLKAASSEELIAARPGDFDAYPWLLNCENGTLDLRTGELRAHDREEHMTKLAPVIFDPAARCDVWQAFLNRIFDFNEPLIGFMQRAAGYTLTGDTGEQCAFILHGPGANGKSTLLETLRKVAGDYGQQAEFSTFMERHGDSPRNDVARMAGARLVTAIESGQGRRLNEPLIKSLTGEDTITARLLYHEHFQFKPQFKLWLATNHKPSIEGTDNAIWRRIRLVPFDVSIPAAEQDHGLQEKLRAELPGILSWAVRGCLAWQKEGLGAPPEVSEATNAYRAEQDDLAAFLAECCTRLSSAITRASEMHKAYKDWGGRDGPREFGMHLKESGLTSDRGTGGVRVWRGIGLLATGSDA